LDQKEEWHLTVFCISELSIGAVKRSLTIKPEIILEYETIFIVLFLGQPDSQNKEKKYIPEYRRIPK